MRRRGSAHPILGLSLACFIGGAAAAGASASMMVTVELKPALSRCVSSALSAQTHALVQVVCSTNQFVGIEPAPNKPFLGTHGAAFRYVLDPSAAVPAEMLPAPDAGGTVTSLRVYDVSASGPPLELLVSF